MDKLNSSIRIVSSGSPQYTHVYDIKTGNKIGRITNIEIYMDAGNLNHAIITIVDPELDIVSVKPTIKSFID